VTKCTTEELRQFFFCPSPNLLLLFAAYSPSLELTFPLPHTHNNTMPSLQQWQHGSGHGARRNADDAQVDQDIQDTHIDESDTETEDEEAIHAQHIVVTAVNDFTTGADQNRNQARVDENPEEPDAQPGTGQYTDEEFDDFNASFTNYPSHKQKSPTTVLDTFTVSKPAAWSPLPNKQRSFDAEKDFSIQEAFESRAAVDCFLMPQRALTPAKRKCSSPHGQVTATTSAPKKKMDHGKQYRACKWRKKANARVMRVRNAVCRGKCTHAFVLAHFYRCCFWNHKLLSSIAAGCHLGGSF